MKTLKIAAVCVIGMLPFTILNAQTPPPPHHPPMDASMGVSGDKAKTPTLEAEQEKMTGKFEAEKAPLKSTAEKTEPKK